MPTAPHSISVAPESAEEIAAVLEDASRARQTVLALGGGTRRGPGSLPTQVDIHLRTSGIHEIIHYEPGDMTVTVGAGLPMTRLAEELGAHGQWLPARGGAGNVANAATIGGLLATAPDAVGDLAHGRLRDRVLGARIALPDGTLARARGRVVKNVAGYDLPRLQVGALGTLGVIVEVSLRVDPLSPSRRTLVYACDDRATAFAAARRLLAAPLAPTFVNVLDDGAGPRVAIGLDGTDLRVDGLTAAVHALLDSEASIRTDESGLRARLDHPAGRLVLRLTARPTDLEARCESACAAFAGHMQALDARPGLGVLLLEIDEREAADVMPAIELLRADGPVVVAEAPPELRRSLDTWGPPGPDFSLMQRIKSAFDPHGVLAPGRGVGGL